MIGLEDVGHPRRDVERDLDVCDRGLPREADGVVEENLVTSGVATNLQRHVGGKLVTPERQKTPEQGAATSVLLATSPDLDGIGGRYFDDCNEVPTVDHRDATGTGVASCALDPANAAAALGRLRGSPARRVSCRLFLAFGDRL